MDERDLEEQRRIRRAAVARHGAAPEPVPAQDPGEKTDEDDNAASQRMDQQALWVDLQVRKAMDRGEFDDLPGAGKPLHLPAVHDPDWWVKRLIEREKIELAPPAIGLRREDAELDDSLDREWAEEGVRRVVDDFNRRVVEARRQLTGGPPVVTRLRDADAEVDRWRERREAARRRGRQRAQEARVRAAAEAEAARAARPSPLRRVLSRLRPR